jgi:hypothetical protein
MVYSNWGSNGLLGLKQLYSDWSSKGLLGLNRRRTWIGAQGLIRLRSMIYSHKVHITTSNGVCQAQTRIQEQRVLGSNQKCGSLRVRHNVYSDSDWSTRV